MFRTTQTTRPTLLPAALAAAMCMAVPLSAHAQDTSRDDRFTLRLSAFNPEAELRFEADGTATDGTDSTSFGGAESFGTGRDWRPRGAINVRISDRQSIGGSYYDYNRDNTWSTAGGLVDPPQLPGGSVEIPAIDASGGIKFALASAYYEYAVVATDAFEWGLGLGATHASLESRGDVAWSASADVEAGDGSFRDKTSGWSPALHTRLTWRPADKWRVDFEGQYLDTEWGDFLDEEGHFERAGVVLEYLVTERFGVHVGYDWFRLKLKDGFAGTLVPPAELGNAPVDVEGTLTAQLKAHGPMAGITYRF
jgi:opacity protein-like surface antigen